MIFTTPRGSLGFILSILALGLLWIGVSSVDANQQLAQGITAPQAGFPAPDFALATPDGDTLSLSELQGRPILVNLWASWCGPCRAEMPAMQRVYEEYQDQGFLILAVNATNQDSETAAVAFAEEHGLTFPLLLDFDGQVSGDYQLRALPSSFFIDRAGVIQEVVIGGPMAEALLITRVETILEGP